MFLVKLDIYSLNMQLCQGAMHYMPTTSVEIVKTIQFLLLGGTTTAPVNNCIEPIHDYWPRKKLDDEIKNIQKGKVKILHGLIGTGKTSVALHHIALNKQKFAISWKIDVSTGEDSIIDLLTSLAEKLSVSYRDLFQTIEQKAEKEDIIFLLGNVENRPSCKWFQELWNIRRSVYIIMTTNNSSLDLADAEQIQVEKFDEAFLDFLEGIHSDNNKEDLKELCSYFGWNILGLTAAKHYMSKNKITARVYLKLLQNRVTAEKVRHSSESSHYRILYESVRACLEEVDSDKFSVVVAATLLVSNNMIPEFLLSNLLSSNNALENIVDLNDLHGQLKSLIHITEENGIRFFSIHPFTQHVIRDMVDGSVQADLLYKLAGIFVRHISKDNRFSKGDFLQRTVREHAEIFLRKWEDKQKDDRTLIALARLSELVGFTYTQQQPFLKHKSDVHFKRARNLLHKLCGISEEDLQPAVGFVHEMLRKYEVFVGSFFQNSGENRIREMYGITDSNLVVANQLFCKLSKKSSELPLNIIEELVFLRTVNKQDLSVFPEVVKENQTVKEKFDSAEPLSPSDVSILVTHGVAYSVDQYRELFLPELYLSVIYSFGRNYFYQNRVTIENPGFHIDLLKLGYCLSREISKRMNIPNAVFHEFLVQTNGLLYLLVNDDYFRPDGTHVKKEAQTHARDLKSAIDRYRQLICERTFVNERTDERTFFEMGILKRTKDDTYSKIKPHQQILKCYKNLLSLEGIDDCDQYIKNGVQRCDYLLKLLDIYASPDVDRKKEDLVRYSRPMNAIAEFYLSINRKEYYSQTIKIFAISAEHAEKYDLTLYYLEALVGLADVFSRIGKYRLSAIQVSARHLKRCNGSKSLLEMQRQKPPIQERISKIQKRNVAMVLKHHVLLRHRHEGGKNEIFFSVFLNIFFEGKPFAIISLFNFCCFSV